MAMSTIEELFEHELKDIYGAETSILAALEQMAGESSDREIKKGFQQHRKEAGEEEEKPSRHAADTCRPESSTAAKPDSLPLGIENRAL